MVHMEHDHNQSIPELIVDIKSLFISVKYAGGATPAYFACYLLFIIESIDSAGERDAVFVQDNLKLCSVASDK